MRIIAVRQTVEICQNVGTVFTPCRSMEYFRKVVLKIMLWVFVAFYVFRKTWRGPHRPDESEYKILVYRQRSMEKCQNEIYAFIDRGNVLSPP